MHEYINQYWLSCKAPVLLLKTIVVGFQCSKATNVPTQKQHPQSEKYYIPSLGGYSPM